MAGSLQGRAENIVYTNVMDSTHSMAIRLIEQAEREELEPGTTVIIAGTQTLGMGRCERRWESPSGGLYFNWVHSQVPRDTITRLPMLAAAAARGAVAKLGIDRAGIKWPNDIVVGGKKLGGILVHARHGSPAWVTVGVGINLEVSPTVGPDATLPPTAVSEHLPDAPVEERREAIVLEFVDSLSRALPAPEGAIEEWRQHLVHRPGDRLDVRLSTGRHESGSYVGLTEEGFLRLEQDGVERVISGGDVIEQGET
jgi:BirA family biotin operon repressor/biotin-[acetyl-CoA-carboxylase] ligase